MSINNFNAFIKKEVYDNSTPDFKVIIITIWIFPNGMSTIKGILVWYYI